MSKPGRLLAAAAVAVVLALIAWGALFSIEEPTDRAAIRALAQGWAAQQPQAAGPAAAHRDRAQAALLAAQDAEAVEALIQALALEPDSTDGLLMLVLASQSGASGALDPAQQQAVRAVVAEVAPAHPLLPVVDAWTTEEGPIAALAALGPPPDPPLGALVRMRSLHAAQQDAADAAAAVLEAAPGQPLACELVARASLGARQPARALLTLEQCAEAGAKGAMLARLRADALDQAGLFQEAAQQYRDSGLDIHAAAIFIQEGGAGEADIEALLRGGGPAVALHRLWWGILRSDPERIAEARAALDRAGVAGLEFETAAAAAALAEGEPAAALDILGERDAPQSHALRARALLAQGEGEAALAAAEQALAVVPWHARLQLLRAAVLAEVQPEAADAAMAAALGRHPVEVAAYSWYRHRDLPWAALVPTQELPGPGRRLLNTQLPTLELVDGEGGGAVVEGVRAAQALAAGGDVGGAIGRLEALGEAAPDAAGVQRLIVALRRQ